MPDISQKAKSRKYRSDNADKFVKNGNGTFGGYKKGVQNGPDPTNKKRRDKSKHTPYTG